MLKNFARGDNPNGLLGIENKEGSTFKEWKKLLKDDLLHVAASDTQALFIQMDGSVFLSGQYCSGLEKIELNEDVVKLSSSFYFFAVLTSTGKTYVLGDVQSRFGFETKPDNKTFTEVPLFKEKNIVLKDLICGVIQCYWISENNELWASGSGGSGRLGNGSSNDVKTPTKVHDSVERVFSGVYSYHMFYITMEGKLFGCGEGGSGKLGNGSDKQEIIPKEIIIKGLNTSEILDIQGGYSQSVLLTTSGEIYTCGSSNSGQGENVTTNVFTKLKIPEGVVIKKIAVSCHPTLMLSQNNEFYYFGGGSGLASSPTPTKLECDLIDPSDNIELISGSFSFFIYETIDQTKNDFANLLESGASSDCTIHNIKAHKILIETRTKKTFETIKKLLEEKYDQEIAQNFLTWVYTEKITNLNIKPILVQLGFEDFKRGRLQRDLELLYKDEDSKDFNILVNEDLEDEEKNNYQDDDENDDDDDDDDEIDKIEIPVHKFILQARSGLFREMFENTTVNSNSVQDFSQKTPESLEILIKFFYTGKIELTADDDPELIVEELEDAQEYYQLSNNINLKTCLQKIRKQFNLEKK
ncbi:btk-binding protein-related [Anaeramoeba flamelloides]|uniref:Btk-binding protein-related n=1 Tax=Anaeramoeba flamelloides TaxID=1746091 RepID=A0ABQ8Z2Z6_9EUKA|nr:btk-binding protein-related [Anaeramoeba flamelloides]